MIQTFKTYFKNKALSKLKEKQKAGKRYLSWDQIKSVMIIFDGTEISRLGRINNIIRVIISEGKNVRCLAYFNDIELADICLTQNNIDFISKKEFDWKGIPNEEIVRNYFSDSYDLCLNLCLKDVPAVDVLQELCDASLKTGKNIKNDTTSDFVMNIADDKDETFLAEQIKYYLRSVKSYER